MTEVGSASTNSDDLSIFALPWIGENQRLGKSCDWSAFLNFSKTDYVVKWVLYRAVASNFFVRILAGLGYWKYWSRNIGLGLVGLSIRYCVEWRECWVEELEGVTASRE